MESNAVFDISWGAIIKILGAGAFTYVVLPGLLVLRDLLLHEIIGKALLTKHLNRLIMMCESDRWFLKNEYSKPLVIAHDSNDTSYKLDGENITKEQYLEYKDGKEFHLKRFEYTNSKIILRHNLITWLTKHYKQVEGGNPIPNLRKKYYEIASLE